MPDDRISQDDNRSWWNENPMNYDWQRTLQIETGTAEYFDEIDRRFFSSSPFYEGDPPFSHVMPLDRVAGRRVLEIGCGLGSHAELLARAGANLSAVDLTPAGVEATKQRMQVRGLAVDVRRMDAERIEFDDDTFDLVWSWGVIHHSAHPEQILREMARVLKPGGEVQVMVYNRGSLQACANLVRGALAGKYLRGERSADILNDYSDGFVARHFVPEELAQMMIEAGLVRPATRILGQKVEVLPLPGIGPIAELKQRAVRFVPDAPAEKVLRRWGWFLMARAFAPD